MSLNRLGLHPRISIAIITRNRRTYLEECVNSLLKQEYPDFEILIGDNGSLDDTREYVEQLQSQHSNIKAFFYERNLGSCEGRNRLLQQATGELWFIIDDDAALQFKDHLIKCALEFDKYPKAGAIGFTVVNADDPSTINLWMYQADPKKAKNIPFKSAQFASCAVCFRSVAMKDAAFSPGEYFVNSFFYSWDEFPIAWRLLETGWECWYSPAIAVRHYGSSTIDTPTAHRVQLDAKSVGQFAGLILPFPFGWGKYVLKLSAWMFKRAARTGTIKPLLSGFMAAVPAFFYEFKKAKKVRPETVKKFIALVEAEKLVGLTNETTKR